MQAAGAGELPPFVSHPGLIVLPPCLPNHATITSLCPMWLAFSNLIASL